MIIGGIGAFFATCGFAILFNIRGINILYAAIGGTLGALTYLILFDSGLTLIFSIFFAALVISMYSEFMARIKKIPVTLFLATSLIPLVPGGSMYRSLIALMRNDITLAQSEGGQTILVVGALVLGILVVSTIVKIRKPRLSYGKS